MDILIAGSALLIFAPIFLILAGLIRCHIGGPVFFRQQRPGLNGKPFWIIKFRTMTNDRNTEGVLLPDAERQTRLGEILRATSLDELPELFNVVKGDMSLIGPRPLLMEYLSLYDDKQHRRHEVRPGITGWAQVNGRNLISWQDKFQLDLWYVENRSLKLDLKIIWLTIIKVLLKEGISAKGHATVGKFKGN